MQPPVRLAAIAVLVISCGPSSRGSLDGSNTTGPCAVDASGLTVTGGSSPPTMDDLSCTGTVNGNVEDCGPGTAASMVTHTACSDGHGFTVTGGSATLYIHLSDSTGSWTAGAQFEGGLGLTGTVTVYGVPAPPQMQPTAGTAESLSFVLQGTTSGQDIVANGDLETNW